MPKEPISLVDALNVLTAARAVSLSSKELEIPTDNVVPVLLAIKGQVDDRVTEFAQKETVKVLETDEKDIKQALSFKNEQSDELQVIALRVFGHLIEKQAG